jgi:DNA polymerase-3 subunit gamma/tau
MSQAFYRKWRPASWDEVVGQDHIVQTLQNAVITDHVGHAYLFGGPRGTGKTTSARLLAKAVNCLHPDPSARPCNECAICVAINQGRFMDLIEIDAASNTSVEDVRDLREKINFSPSQGKFKVYIIDEVHMLSTSAFNALLKTLEEPPAHVIFILATTEIHKIPATVLSRCQRHEFRRIPVQIITAKLRKLCNEEGIQIRDETLNLIARQSTGSLRDAISLVDQLSSMTNNISLEVAQDILGTATSQSVIDLVDAILKEDEAGGLGRIHQALDAGSDPRQFARQVVDYLRGLLLVKMGLSNQVEVPAEVKSSMTEHAAQIEMQALLAAINAFSDAATDLKASWHPGLGLEIAFATIVTNAAKSSTPQIKDVSGEEETPSHIENQKPSKKTKGEPDTPRQIQEINPKTTVKEKTKTEARTVGEASPTPIHDDSPKHETSLKSLNENWKAVRDIIRKDNPMTEALVNSARLLGMKNEHIILSFPSELLKERMLKGNNIAITSKALKQVFGKDMKVKCIIGGKNNSQIADDLEIDSDGMVGLATRDLGGEIVEIE